MSYWAIWNMEEALRELNELLESPERIPYIDWDEVDKIFEYWLTKIMNMGPDSPPISRRTSMLLLRMCQSVGLSQRLVPLYDLFLSGQRTAYLAPFSRTPFGSGSALSAVQAVLYNTLFWVAFCPLPQQKDGR